MAALITDEEGNFVPQILDANSLQYTEIKGENNSQYVMTYAVKPKNLILHNSSTSIGNGTDFTVDGYGIVRLQVTGIFVGTITVKGSVDGTNFVAIKTIKEDSSNLSSITTQGIYEVNCNGLLKIRAQITAYTSGNITVLGKTMALNSNYSVIEGNVDIIDKEERLLGKTTSELTSNASQLVLNVTTSTVISAGGNHTFDFVSVKGYSKLSAAVERSVGSGNAWSIDIRVKLRDSAIDYTLVGSTSSDASYKFLTNDIAVEKATIRINNAGATEITVKDVLLYARV